MFLRLYIFFIISFLSTLLSGQKTSNILDNKQFKFEEFTSKDGLKHHSITEVSQDSRGYMWFGTFNGIYKYDGYTFKIYKNKIQDKNSLIENNINVVKEDSFGNIWVGTNGGLCRFNRDKDNFNRIIYTSDLSKPDLIIKDKIYCILQDVNNVLWIGTNTGLYQLTKNKSRDNTFSIKHFSSKNNNLHSDIVKSIIQDEKGNIWVGTSNGLNLLSYKDANKIKFYNYTKFLRSKNYLSNNFITSTALDYNGNLWIGTGHGLNKLVYSPDGNYYKIENFYNNKDDPKSIAGNEITTICPDKNRTVWIGTKSTGVSRYLYNKNIFENYSKNDFDENSINSNQISNIFQDQNGVIWISSISGYLNKLDLKKKSIAHFKKNPWNNNSLSDNIINTIFEDSKKNLWIGTNNGGLNKVISKDGITYFTRYSHSSLERTSLSSNNIFSFCEDNYGNYWAGTPGDGLNHIKAYSSTNSEKIIVRRYNKSDGQSNLPTNYVTTLFKDSKGDIWMGSYFSGTKFANDGGDGLMKFTPNKFGENHPKISQYKFNPKNENSISSNNVSFIFEDHENILWVGTYGGGITKILRDENNNPLNFVRIKNDPNNINSLNNNNVFSIYEDFDYNLWIGTYGGGLNKLPSTEKNKKIPFISYFTKKDGLPSNELYGILQDQNHNLWISSNNGISKFNPDSEVFTNFNSNDGLQDSNYRKLAYYKGYDGIMYFGGINGFNGFNPNNFKDNKIEPKIEIVDFKLFNKSISVGEEVLGKKILNKSISETDFIELNNDHNSFSFEYSALHYSSSNQNKYAHKLEGFDKDWIFTDAKRRFASYSHLDPGNYVFKVKASNNDNLWSKNIKEVKIKVLPPLWRSWWAYILYSLFFVFLMFLFRRVILQRQEYQNKLKIEKIQQEKIIEMNKMKLEFFTNISHEFKTPLTLILGPLQSIIKETKKNPKISESFKLVERNANHLFKLINQVMEFREVESKEQQLSPSHGELVSFCKDEVKSFKSLAREKNIDLIFNCNKKVFFSDFDWDNLQKIIDNLLSNSIKYTSNQGIIRFSLNLPENFIKGQKINNEKIIIEVEDTGIGIPKNQLALIFNRFYKIDSKDRSSSMGSGIGLALTKSLIELNKGTIRVKSKEGIGSLFTVELPSIIQIKKQGLISKTNNLMNNSLIKNNLDPNDFISSDDKENEIVSETILVVEDNPDLQDFIRSSLKSEYTILQAYDGVEGLDLAKNKVPDIIISDVMMPNKDGIEFCKDVKSDLITNHIPFIMLTARSSIKNKIEGLEIGADAYISKPFHIEILTAQIQNLLNQRELLKLKFSGNGLRFTSRIKGIKKSEKQFLEKAEKIIDKNLTNSQFGVPDLGKGIGLSRMQLYRKLKSIRGLNANEFIREYRIKKAAQLMGTTELNVSEILFEVGFSNRSYFTKCFKKLLGVTPREYIKKMESETTDFI